MSRKRNRRNAVSGSRVEEGSRLASKIQLVESVIMNNTSCARHAHSRKSLSYTDTVSAKKMEIAAVENAEEGLQPVHCMQ